MESRSSRTTCEKCFCGACPQDAINGSKSKACVNLSCLNRYKIDHHHLMKSNLCSFCDSSRLQNSVRPPQDRVAPSVLLGSLSDPTQGCVAPSVLLDSLSDPPQDCDAPSVLFDSLSIDTEALVRSLDGTNQRAKEKDRYPSLGKNDVLTYIISLKKAYLDLCLDSESGYDTLSEAQYEKLRSEVSETHETVSKWTTERWKGILFRRIHVFIRDKLGMSLI